MDLESIQNNEKRRIELLTLELENSGYINVSVDDIKHFHKYPNDKIENIENGSLYYKVFLDDEHQLMNTNEYKIKLKLDEIKEIVSNIEILFDEMIHK